MKHLILMMSMVATAYWLWLPESAGVKDAGHAALRMEIGQGQQNAEQAPPKAFRCPQKEGSRATCPVAGQPFTITKDTPSSQLADWCIYVYFCCPPCKPVFDKEPEKYLREI